MPLWQELLVLFGGNATLLAACAWLIKSLLTHRLARDIKVFETELKAKADASTEQHKSLLQIAALEHQVRFSNLHEKRAEVIATLYIGLVQTFFAGQSFLSPIQFPGELSKQEKAKETWDKMRECYLFFEMNRIYLSHPLCTLLEKFIEDMRLRILEFDMCLDPEDPIARKKKLTVWRDGNEAFANDIPAARRALETEFRKILGVDLNFDAGAALKAT